jgi:hypothetical protein
LVSYAILLISVYNLLCTDWFECTYIKKLVKFDLYSLSELAFE